MLARLCCRSLIVLGLLAAAAPSVTRADEDFAPDPKLVEAAKKEGEVLYYTTHIVEKIVRPMKRALQS